MAGALPQWPDMDYKLSGWLAGQATSEREAMLREAQGLQNLYQQAQTRGQDLTNQGMEAKLPYLGDEARLKNIKSQQEVDMQLPQQDLAKRQAGDPGFMQGQFDIARGKQQGQLNQQEIQNRITHYDMLMDAYATNNLMGAIDTARKLQIPFEQLQGHFQKGGDPLKSMQARRQALATQMSLTPEQVGKERIEGIKGQNDIDVANIRASSDKTVAEMRSGEIDKQFKATTIKELSLRRQVLNDERKSIDAQEQTIIAKSAEMAMAIKVAKASDKPEDRAYGVQLEQYIDNAKKSIQEKRASIDSRAAELDAALSELLGTPKTTTTSQKQTATQDKLTNNTNVDVQRAAQAAWGSYEPDKYHYRMGPNGLQRAKK